MSQSLDHRAANRGRAEQNAIDTVVQRLTSQFPELSSEVIVNAVRGEYAEYTASKVRDFVPILVERSARANLRTHRA